MDRDIGGRARTTILEAYRAVEKTATRNMTEATLVVGKCLSKRYFW